MKIVGVIPARYGSTRLPAKPLLPINGKPLLQWVIEGSKSSRLINEILVATDHTEIAALSENCGVRAVMTDPALPSGSDRVWAAVQNSPADIVVNIQGDEPLITGHLLDVLVRPLIEDQSLAMSTLGRKINAEDLASPNTAKIVLNKNHEAIYFSRHPIPFSRERWSGDSQGALKHIGLYAYRRDFLASFCAHGPVELERAEGLEQLRALYLGARIKVVAVEHESWGVDTPEDIHKIETMLKTKAIYG